MANLSRWLGKPLLSLALLVLALSMVFLFGNDRGYFYRPGHHDWNSSKVLANAENYSLDHNFLVFNRQILDVDGDLTYRPFNRFPTGGYALVKLAILPFGDSLSAKIQAGRTLMLLLFAAAAVVAYLALLRLTAHPWIALTATLLAFSSYFCLYYNDMISNEVMIDLFAVMLVFHGMVIFMQEGRFRQLLLKTCIALLLGWHVFALLLPFIIFGLGTEVFNTYRSFSSAATAVRIRSLVATLLRSRYVTLGVAAIAFGTALLTFNLANEYFALNGEVPLSELSTVQSALKRTGQSDSFNTQYAQYLAWPSFLEDQFYRIGKGSLPYTLSSHANPLGGNPSGPWGLQTVVIGIVVFGASLVGILIFRQKILAATLVLSGFCWAMPLRNNVAFHDFETVFYVGIPLVFFCLVLLVARRLFGDRLVAGLSIVALLTFFLSTYQMAQVGHDARAAEFQRTIVADFEAIREIADGKVVFVPNSSMLVTGVRHGLDYYLSGNIIVDRPKSFDHVDFLVTRLREEGPDLLTAENRLVFLYEPHVYEGQVDRMLAEVGNPVISSRFDVYVANDSLIYAKDRCSQDDTSSQFFLHIVPLDNSDLPPERRRYGFDNFDFRFHEYSREQASERCLAIVWLPQYSIRHIRTGQFETVGGSYENLWEGSFSLGEK